MLSSSNRKSDWKTILGMLCEAVFEFNSNGYWLGYWLDIIRNFSNAIDETEDEFFLGLSTPAFVFGTVLGLLTAIGSTYSHYLFNKRFQDEEEIGENTPLDTDHLAPYTTPSTPLLRNRLSCFEGFIIFGDAVSHIADCAWTISVVGHLALTLNYRDKLILQSLATGFGVLTTVATVRTCKNNFLSHSRGTKAHSHTSDDEESDRWTRIGLVGYSIVYEVCNVYWVGSWADLLTDVINGMEEFHPDDDVGGLNTHALIIGCILGSFSSLGAIYCDYKTNKRHQCSNPDDDVEQEDTVKSSSPCKYLGYQGFQELSKWQKLAIIGDRMTHLGENASGFSFVGNLAYKLSTKNNLILNCCATGIGFFSSMPYSRTCFKNVLKDIQTNKAKEENTEEDIYSYHSRTVSTRHSLNTEETTLDRVEPTNTLVQFPPRVSLY